MTETPAFLADRLQAECAKTISFFNALSAEDWETTIYADGGQWTVRQILAHFVATEQAITQLIEDILQGGSGTPEDFNIDQYNEISVKSWLETPEHKLLDEFLQARQKLESQVAGLDERDLERQGRHPFLGMAPLAEIIKLAYRHPQIHQRDIRKHLPPRERSST